jgi:hypothetical protein
VATGAHVGLLDNQPMCHCQQACADHNEVSGRCTGQLCSGYVAMTDWIDTWRAALHGISPSCEHPLPPPPSYEAVTDACEQDRPCCTATLWCWILY